MSEEVYLDDLDKELAEYNKATTGAKLRPVEKDGGYDVSRYEFQTEAVNNSLLQLSAMGESLEKDIRAVDTRKTSNQIGCFLSGFGMVLSAAIFIGFGYLGLTQGIGGAVSFGLLCIMGGVGAVFFGLRFANHLTAHLVMKKAGPHSHLVESNFIRSYAGEKEFCMDCLNEIGSRSSKLRRFKEKIEKEGHISEEEMEQVRRLGDYHRPPTIYKFEDYRFGEWANYMLTTRKATKK